MSFHRITGMPCGVHAGLLWVQLLMSLSGISNGRALSYLNNKQQQPTNCVQLPTMVLSNILGGAYNSRYMSIEEPPVMEEGEMDGKRGAANGIYPPFSVENEYSEPHDYHESSHKAAWNVDHVKDTANQVLRAPINKREAFDSLLDEVQSKSRSTRNARRGQSNGISRPWKCDAKFRWIDLGDEFYPRYLRTVECPKSSCWYGHSQCTPRAFEVKMLRRHSGQCVPADGLEGFTGKLSELWVWVTRSVTFCCECSLDF